MSDSLTLEMLEEMQRKVMAEMAAPNIDRIITNIYMVEDGEPYETQCTWKERLVSWPWRPWKRTRTVVPKLPSRQIITMNGYYIMHPAIAEKLKGVA